MSRKKFRGRPVNGVLLLDKPSGITSNAALQMVKSMFNARKAGHTGSLDPLASGLLPICFGEATKFSQFLLDANKEYVVVARLGEVTDTSDADGKIIKTHPVPALTEAQLETALAPFRGEIQQIPSMFSAIKHQGEPLYKLARAGIEVERKPRAVTIFDLELQDLGANEMTLYVRCSKGTYIRTLVQDIGEVLGCGAHVVALRRLSAGAYDAKGMVSMEKLQALVDARDWPSLNNLLLTDESMVEDYPDVVLNEACVGYVSQGQSVRVSGAPTQGLVRLYGPEQRFLGVGEINDDGKVAPKRLKA